MTSGLPWGLILYGEEEEKFLEASTDPVLSAIWKVLGIEHLYDRFGHLCVREKRKCHLMKLMRFLKELLLERWSSLTTRMVLFLKSQSSTPKATRYSFIRQVNGKKG